MNNIQKKPYIAVIRTENGRAVCEEGVIHSLEEYGVPFRCSKTDRQRESGPTSVLERFETPLGMIVLIEQSEVSVYYRGYDPESPVLRYGFPQGAETDAEALYRLARGIGRNAANIICGKEIKELEWSLN